MTSGQVKRDQSGPRGEALKERVRFEKHPAKKKKNLAKVTNRTYTDQMSCI